MGERELTQEEINAMLDRGTEEFEAETEFERAMRLKAAERMYEERALAEKVPEQAQKEAAMAENPDAFSDLTAVSPVTEQPMSNTTGVKELARKAKIEINKQKIIGLLGARLPIPLRHFLDELAARERGAEVLETLAKNNKLTVEDLQQVQRDLENERREQERDLQDAA